MTSEEVEKLIGQLRHSRIETVIDKAHDAADLIERLARENANCANRNAGYIGEQKRMLERIEELKVNIEKTKIWYDNELREFKQRAKRAEQQRDEYRKLADGAICLVSQGKAFSLWQEMDRIRAMGDK